MSTVRITTAEALVRYLVAQRTVVDGTRRRCSRACSRSSATATSPAWATPWSSTATRSRSGAARARRAWGWRRSPSARRPAAGRSWCATSSIGPGATNFVTAAGVAMSNRIPALFISGDTFTSRLPDPVLQQVEHFGDPTTTVNDSFRPVVRYWDRISHPAQLSHSLPQVTRTLLDPADCGPVFLGLPQDVAATAYDYPVRFFEPVVHRVPRPRADRAELEQAAAGPARRRAPRAHRRRRGPLLARRGRARRLRRRGTASRSWRPSPASPALRRRPPALDRARSGSPGPTRPTRRARLPTSCSPSGPGSTTSSPGRGRCSTTQARIVALNTARFDASKHRPTPVVGRRPREPRRAVRAARRLDGAAARGPNRASGLRERLEEFVAGRVADDGALPLSYAQVIGAVHRRPREDDYVMTAAGGLPGELNVNWMSKARRELRLRVRVLLHGLRDRRGLGCGVRAAGREGEVFCLVGDGSYLMLNSEIYSSVLSGRKFVLIVCDNARVRRHRAAPAQPGRQLVQQHAARLARAEQRRAGRLRRARGLAGRPRGAGVDRSPSSRPRSSEARRHDRTSVVVVDVRESDWTEGEAVLAGRRPRGERPRLRAATPGPRTRPGWPHSGAACDAGGERSRGRRRPRQQEPRPTIRDIAARAGVSKSLVSLALQQRPPGRARDPRGHPRGGRGAGLPAQRRRPGPRRPPDPHHRRLRPRPAQPDHRRPAAGRAGRGAAPRLPHHRRRGRGGRRRRARRAREAAGVPGRGHHRPRPPAPARRAGGLHRRLPGRGHRQRSSRASRTWCR